MNTVTKLRLLVHYKPKERAEELFLEYLTRKQRYQYLTKRTIDVTGSDGLTYRIRCNGNVVENVWCIPDKTTYCGFPSLSPVIGPALRACDVYLGQLLLLQTDAIAFRRVAISMRRMPW